MQVCWYHLFFCNALMSEAASRRSPLALPQNVAKSYACVWFGNTDEKSDVQQLFLWELMIVVADGGGWSLALRFSWLLFQLNQPKTEKEDKMENCSKLRLRRFKRSMRCNATLNLKLVCQSQQSDSDLLIWVWFVWFATKYWEANTAVCRYQADVNTKGPIFMQVQCQRLCKRSS